MGVGPTGVACMKTDRSFIGYEIDENYFKIAQTRITEEYEEVEYCGNF
jgi:DNA modification methylase